jgi:hypothetical protein
MNAAGPALHQRSAVEADALPVEVPLPTAHSK